MKSGFLQELKQYHFDRDEFTAAFMQVLSEDEIFDLEDACRLHKEFNEFLLYYDTFEEYYIIHLKSGTIINWYKHLGRTNTCNKEGFTIEDLKEFLAALKEDMRGNAE
jgi:hypothetical protein